MQHECQTRPTPCRDCQELVPVRDHAAHLRDDCSYRIIVCPKGCGKTKRWGGVKDEIATFNKILER